MFWPTTSDPRAMKEYRFQFWNMLRLFSKLLKRPFVLNAKTYSCTCLLKQFCECGSDPDLDQGGQVVVMKVNEVSPV